MLNYILIAVAAGIITILGGLLSLKTNNDSSVRYWIALAAGLLIGTALFEMLPEIEGKFFIVAIGFFFMYVLSKLLLIHACGEYECEIHTITWPALLSMAVDNIVDGMAIASGFLINPVAALVIALAISIHEGIQSFSAVIIMKKDRYPKWKMLFTLILFGLTIPLGALFFGTFLVNYLHYLLAFAAGIFIYVGASDMLPEAHQKFNIGVVASVVLGALIVPVMSYFLGA